MIVDYITPKRAKLFDYLLFVIVFIVVMSRNVVLFTDSPGYIDQDIIRSPIYPLFLNFTEGLSSTNFNTVTAFFQVILGLLAIHVFMNVIRKVVQLHWFCYLLLTIIVVSPYVYNHTIANRFLSEALAYPLYLVVVSRFLLLIAFYKKKYLWQGILFLFILLLTRTQFLFLVPIASIVCFYLGFSEKKIKKWILPISLLILLPFITQLADKTYHKLQHGVFISTPWTGIHLVAPAMFVADEEDRSLFTSEREKLFFSTLYASLAEKELNINHLSKENALESSAYYRENFTKIANRTIYEEGKMIVAANEPELKRFIAVENITKEMALPLITDNFKKWCKVYIQNYILGFGTARTTLLYVLILGFSLVMVYKRSNSISKILTFVMTLLLANVAIVAIGMYTIKRFTFYNDWVIFLVVFILLQQFSEKLDIKKSQQGTVV
ncbi:hypothetical protein ACFQO1_11560 [Jejudonia soesokkakensis]|uniref:Glycosyltransferase RgtA/B/C/D-like domain-containing protein n=1 Tax=Jejudonia soesokkakensis TaxID=1323432 RepID=A0ABW2MTR6_9FLAO